MQGGYRPSGTDRGALDRDDWLAAVVVYPVLLAALPALAFLVSSDLGQTVWSLAIFPVAPVVMALVAVRAWGNDAHWGLAAGITLANGAVAILLLIGVLGLANALR